MDDRWYTSNLHEVAIDIQEFVPPWYESLEETGVKGL
jgi:hypothetical protein